MAGQWKFWVDDKPWDRSRALYMCVSNLRVDSYIGPMTLITPPQGSGMEPTLTESREERQDALGDVTGFLQGALDAAWELGMRPKAYADHTNELKAVRYHLEDMRTLALPKT